MNFLVRGVRRCEARAAVDYADLLGGQLNPSGEAIVRLCAFDKFYLFACAIQLTLAATAITQMRFILPTNLYHLVGLIDTLMRLSPEELKASMGYEKGAMVAQMYKLLGFLCEDAVAVTIAYELSRMVGLNDYIHSLIAPITLADRVRIAHNLRTRFAEDVDILIVHVSGTGVKATESTAALAQDVRTLVNGITTLDNQAAAANRVVAPAPHLPKPPLARALPFERFTSDTLKRILRDLGKPAPNATKPRLIELIRAAAGQLPIHFCSISNDSLAQLTAGDLRLVVAYFAVTADTATLKKDLLKRVQAAVAQRCAPGGRAQTS
jgi:hypothetical protein